MVRSTSSRVQKVTLLAVARAAEPTRARTEAVKCILLVVVEDLASTGNGVVFKNVPIRSVSKGNKEGRTEPGRLSLFRLPKEWEDGVVKNC